MSKHEFKGVPGSYNAWREARRLPSDNSPPSEWKGKQVMSMHTDCQDQDRNVGKENIAMQDAESLLIAGMQKLSIHSGSNSDDQSKQQRKMEALIGEEHHEWLEKSKSKKFGKVLTAEKGLKTRSIINGRKHGDVDHIDED